MVKLRRGSPVSGPSSALGIMRFFDAQTSSPKIRPETVLIISVAIVVIVAVVHLLA